MFLSVSYTAQAQIAVESPIKQVKIAGYVGERIDDCIEHRVKAQDVEHLVEIARDSVVACQFLHDCYSFSV